MLGSFVGDSYQQVSTLSFGYLHGEHILPNRMMHTTDKATAWNDMILQAGYNKISGKLPDKTSLGPKTQKTRVWGPNTIILWYLGPKALLFGSLDP